MYRNLHIPLLCLDTRYCDAYFVAIGMNCINTKLLCSFSLTVLQAPAIPNAFVIEESDDLSVICDSSGSIPITAHIWRDSTNAILSTSSVLTLPSITRSQAGVYTCTIEDDMGNTVSASTNITVQRMFTLKLLHTLFYLASITYPAVHRAASITEWLTTMLFFPFRHPHSSSFYSISTLCACWRTVTPLLYI